MRMDSNRYEPAYFDTVKRCNGR